jgi:hypothetical protein
MKEAYYHIYEASKHLALASEKTKHDTLEVVCRDTNNLLQNILRLIDKNIQGRLQRMVPKV